MYSRRRCKPPTKEAIRKIAEGIYHNRLLLNKPGNAQNDWVLAEKIAQCPLRTALFRSHLHLIKLEKRCWEPALRLADKQAWLSLLQRLEVFGTVGILVAASTYVFTEEQRRNAEVLNAWQTITSAHGQAGSGGRTEALEFLNASPGANWQRRIACIWFCTWPAESLNGINLSVESAENFRSTFHIKTSEIATAGEKEFDASQPNQIWQGVYLEGIKLPRASLQDANLIGANLAYADLADANLISANLKGAFLGTANLEKARLGGANLAYAFLGFADLTRADLGLANLTEADLEEANLTGANMERAKLKRANLKGANLMMSNLATAQDLTRDQLSYALLCKTQLPRNLMIDPNRDCLALGY